MLSTPHLLVGGAIVTIIPNPLISFPLAFLSHFLFDYIPHWDFKISPRPKPLLAASIDYLLGLSILFITSIDNINLGFIVFGGLLATLPDFIMASIRVLNTQLLNFWPLSILNNFHHKIQHRVDFFWGSVFSVITIIISIYILTR